MKVLIYKRKGWDLIATPDCYFIGFKSLPEIKREPTQLGSYRWLVPGQKVLQVGRPHHASGESDITMLPGHALEYVGTWRDYVLFKDGDQPKLDGYAAAYFAFSTGERMWFFGTAARAGRMVDTNYIKIAA